MKALYLIGPPGVGKSTLLAATLDRLLGTGRTHVPDECFGVPMIVHRSLGTPRDWVEFGRMREAFGGTDSLSYSIAPAAEQVIRSHRRPSQFCAEGDRLATERFIDALWDVYDTGFLLVRLDGDEVAWTRATARADALGRPPQNAAWWKGRATKSLRLGRRYGATVLDARRPVDDLAGDLAGLLSS